MRKISPNLGFRQTMIIFLGTRGTKEHFFTKSQIWLVFFSKTHLFPKKYTHAWGQGGRERCPGLLSKRWSTLAAPGFAKNPYKKR